MREIGVIGTGNLGSAIVKRLLQKNFVVHIFNRTKYRANEVIALGSIYHSSPKELAEICDVIIICVTDNEASKKVLFAEPDGVVFASNKKLCIIDISTINPRDAISLHTSMKKLSLEYIECPVSGGPQGAINGNLTALICGNRRIITKMRPIIAVFASKIHILSTPGNAQLIKVLNNLSEGINLLISSEIVAICLKNDIDIKSLRSILSSMRGHSVYMDLLFDQLINPKDKVSVTLAVRQKDLMLADSIAKYNNMNNELGIICIKLFESCIKNFGLSLDQTKCIEMFMQSRYDQYN